MKKVVSFLCTFFLAVLILSPFTQGTPSKQKTIYQENVHAEICKRITKFIKSKERFHLDLSHLRQHTHTFLKSIFDDLQAIYFYNQKLVLSI